MKTVAKVIMLIGQICIAGPIWYYLMYKILQYVNASELMWFLYIIYVPISLIIVIISIITNEAYDENTKNKD